MDFKNFFNKQITPKMHYLIHCPRLILLCGPLVKLWNMHFEGKHKDFKKIAKNASFKNITLSLAKSEQRSVLANPVGHILFSDVHLQKGPSTFHRGENLASAKQHFGRVSDCKWVTLYGTKYISNEFSLILWAENEKPVFGDLLGVWIANGTDVLFRVAELETLGFNHTLNSFEVDKLGHARSALYIAPHNLLTHEIVHKCEVDNKVFINTKHIVK